MTTRLIALAVSQAFAQSMTKPGKIVVENPANTIKHGTKSLHQAERRIERACREDFWRERECKQFEVRQEPQREIVRSERRDIVNL